MVVDDVYEDLKDHTEHRDFSDYHTSHPSYDTTNRKVVRKMRVSSVEEPVQVS